MNREDRRGYGGKAARFMHEEWGPLRELLIAKRPILGPDGGIHCEIWEYQWEMGVPFPHVCGLGWEANETLYMRNDFPPAIQWYLLSEINCALVCGAAHNKLGHTLGFRRWFRERQVLRFGSKPVDDFLLFGPNKIKTLGF
jgi:hypothetical protein